MSERAAYTIVWQDHYRFDVKRNGERWLSDCEPGLYDLVCASFRGTVAANARPEPTLGSWFNAVIRGIFGE